MRRRQKTLRQKDISDFVLGSDNLGIIYPENSLIVDCEMKADNDLIALPPESLLE